MQTPGGGSRVSSTSDGLQISPPKRPLRDDFLAQNTIWSAQTPAGRFVGSRYNFIQFYIFLDFYILGVGGMRGAYMDFIRPKGPCGTTFCYSQSEIYDIGTEILIFHSFATKIVKSFCKSIIFSEIESARRDLYFYSIKTWFKALFKKWHSWIRICCFHGICPPWREI